MTVFTVVLANHLSNRQLTLVMISWLCSLNSDSTFDDHQNSACGFAPMHNSTHTCSNMASGTGNQLLLDFFSKTATTNLSDIKIEKNNYKLYNYGSS